jgi:hypothetical protein
MRERLLRRSAYLAAKPMACAHRPWTALAHAGHAGPHRPRPRIGFMYAARIARRAAADNLRFRDAAQSR